MRIIGNYISGKKKATRERFSLYPAIEAGTWLSRILDVILSS